MNKKRTCPQCGSEMARVSINDVKMPEHPPKIWDQGVTGRISTAATGTLTEGYASKDDYASTSGHGSPYGVAPSQPPEAMVDRSVVLIPYVCPGCGYQESYRD